MILWICAAQHQKLKLLLSSVTHLLGILSVQFIHSTGLIAFACSTREEGTGEGFFLALVLLNKASY
jgi:hypothetical protein